MQDAPEISLGEALAAMTQFPTIAHNYRLLIVAMLQKPSGDVTPEDGAELARIMENFGRDIELAETHNRVVLAHIQVLIDQQKGPVQ